jgi:hypothetical protein
MNLQQPNWHFGESLGVETLWNLLLHLKVEDLSIVSGLEAEPGTVDVTDDIGSLWIMRSILCLKNRN